MSKPFYITTPVYYANAAPHIGQAYTSIAADAIARFHRLAGREVFLLTGTDEHGTKIAEAAAQAGKSEIEFLEEIVKQFVARWKNLSIDYDDYIRTTSDRHKKAVWKILDAMRKAKTPDGQEVVYTDYYEGLYCNGCEKFITEKELVDGVCPDHGTEPVKLKEKNYFFRLRSFVDEIKRRITEGELQILPDERRREVIGLIDQDLPDFSLSRERVAWGIPLSFDKSQRAYVWVDALTNYISAIGYADNEELFDKWWNNGEVVHLMAKDILKFHCLFWPAMLMAAGVKLPDTIFLHGFFTIDGNKMSKTRGNFIDPDELVRAYGADATRYLLLTQYPFGIDGDIQMKRFGVQYNADLANDLGNLVSRVMKMIMTSLGGKIPKPVDSLDGVQELLEQAEELPEKAYAHMKHFRIGRAIDMALGLVRSTNKFFNDNAPWQLAKTDQLEKMGGILYVCCELIRIVSIVLFPVMPNKMREIRAVLSLDDTTLTLDNARQFFQLEPGRPVNLKSSVFPRIHKAPKVDENKGSSGTEKAVDESGLLDIKEFGRIDLRIARVEQAERVEGANKLLKLQINIGSEKRQIVAGIAETFAPEEIVGKTIVVVANLKPATIRGVKSQGMLLAAKANGELQLLTVDGDIPAGTDVG